MAQFLHMCFCIISGQSQDISRKKIILACPTLLFYYPIYFGNSLVVN